MIEAREDHVAVIRRRFNPARVTGIAAWVTRDNVNELLSMHGFGGELPESYELRSAETKGTAFLRSWVKVGE